MTEKWCSECKTTKPIEAFKKHNKARNGYQNMCIDCKETNKQKILQENKQEILEAMRNEDKKQSSYYKHILYSLDKYYVLTKDACFSCNTAIEALQQKLKIAKIHPNSKIRILRPVNLEIVEEH